MLYPQGFSGGSVERMLMSVETGGVVNLDRWLLFMVPNEELQGYVSVHFLVKCTQHGTKMGFGAHFNTCNFDYRYDVTFHCSTRKTSIVIMMHFEIVHVGFRSCTLVGVIV